MAGDERAGLDEVGEEAIVASLIATLPSDPSVVVGAGDDCAVVEKSEGLWQLLKTDCVIEGVHFLPDTDPVAVGRKAINRVLSDMAAMGGRPCHAMVTLAVDGERSVAEIEGWYRGINEVAGEVGCFVVGGETARLNELGAILSIAMTGEVASDSCVLRSGARPGDVIAVTGYLGGSFDSGRHLTFEPRLKEASWLAENFLPTAMMDLSDGLGSDLPRLAQASGVGFKVYDHKIPCHVDVAIAAAISEGEDYELLMTVSADQWEQLSAAWSLQFPEIPLTQIGEIREKGEGGLPRGWEHFSR